MVRVSVPALLALVANSKRVDLRKGKIKATHSGGYISLLKGRGMEFDESRLYQAGDDIRHLDWRVTARTNKPHSKLFRQEQERPVFLWVDQRAPMRFATRGKFKSVVAAEIASLLAWSAVEHGDRVGGVVFSDHIHHETKPKCGKSAVLRLMHLLADDSYDSAGQPAQEIKHGSKQVILRLRRLVKPGSLIFLISDFRGFDDMAKSQLVQISKHSDLVFVFIYDPLEMELPPVGYYQISYDHQRMIINTHNKELVSNYREKFIARKEYLQSLANLCKTLLITCSTIDDPSTVLHQRLHA